MSNPQLNFSQQPICFGTILQNQDKDHPNQVKVQLATLYEEGFNETWAYLAIPFGGEQYGFHFVPEVGEQVLIAFPYGELPIVVASVCGSKEAPPECSDNPENHVKVLKTKGGNLLRINDKKDHTEILVQTAGGAILHFTDEDEKITVADKDNKNTIVLDAKNGDVTVSADKSVAIKVGGTAVLEADKSSLTLKSSKISIQADQALEEKGGQLKMSGQTAELNASGQVTISSNGMTQVTGSILKLNG